MINIIRPRSTEILLALSLGEFAELVQLAIAEAERTSYPDQTPPERVAVVEQLLRIARHLDALRQID